MPKEIPKNTDKDFQNLRGNEINEILGQPPAWLTRWGSGIFFLILLLVSLSSWFIRYPDIIKGDLKIVADNLPKSAIVKSEGKLVELFVNDGEIVSRKQHIAYLESVASHKEVLSLDSVTNYLVMLSLAEPVNENLYQSAVPTYFQLGELQKSYQIFHEAFIKVKSFVNEGMYLKKKEFLLIDLTTLNSLKDNLLKQQENLKQDFAMSQEEFERQKDLLKDRIISKNEYNQLVSKVLLKKQSYEQISSTIRTQDININQKKQDILELDRSIIEYKNSFKQSLYALKSDIETWKRRFIVEAPSSGKVVFLQNLQENQTLKNGQELLYILPSGEGFHAEMNIGQFNFGKIKVGQKTIIKFQSFPYEEFGSIVGRVESISDIPQDSLFFIRVNLPNGLITSAGKKIPFKNGMLGSGEIITDNRRLIMRFMDKLIKAFER